MSERRQWSLSQGSSADFRQALCQRTTWCRQAVPRLKVGLEQSTACESGVTSVHPPCNGFGVSYFPIIPVCLFSVCSLNYMALICLWSLI